MQTQRLSRYVAALSIAAAFLAGCGGSQPPIGAPRVVSQSRAIATHATLGKSWISPGVSELGTQRSAYGNQDLLYVTTLGNVAYVLSFPDGNVLGYLTFHNSNVSNLCVDGVGDVYFIFDNHTESHVVEYAHGGSEPIQTFTDDSGTASSCSVDPLTGHLAVTNFDDGRGGNGSVLIYQDATTQPAIYTDPHVPHVVSGAYDNKGNLMVDGTLNFAILAKDSSQLSDVVFKRAPKEPGTIVWDGSYFAVGNDFVSNKKRLGTRVSRVQIQGSTGSVVSKVKLLGKKIQFGFVYDDVAIATLGTKKKQLAFWNYPGGGDATKVIPPIAKQTVLTHEAVSPASSQRSPTISQSARSDLK